VLFRLAYLGVTNALARLRLLPMSDRDKDTEILVLRHQIAILERQLDGEKVRFTRGRPGVARRPHRRRHHRRAQRCSGAPRMNSIMERWIQACRHELLDRTLIWNHTHLLHALREYGRHRHRKRPHRDIANARPLHPLPEPITGPATITHLHIRRHDRLGGLLCIPAAAAVLQMLTRLDRRGR
jgi:hypothetical protein